MANYRVIEWNHEEEPFIFVATHSSPFKTGKLFEWLSGIKKPDWK